jgi:hypothetical protein
MNGENREVAPQVGRLQQEGKAMLTAIITAVVMFLAVSLRVAALVWARQR